jgi:uncharacterized coiled-coil DUF342 family protein
MTEYEDLYNDSRHIEQWNPPPPPPTIEFMPKAVQAWKGEIPKSITNKKQGNTKRKSAQHSTTSGDHDQDNHTTTTANTNTSYTQDTISELQNTSQQHQQLIYDLRNDSQTYRQTMDELQQHRTQIAHSVEQHTHRLDKMDSQLQLQLSDITTNMEKIEEEQKIQKHHQEKCQKISTRSLPVYLPSPKGWNNNRSNY